MPKTYPLPADETFPEQFSVVRSVVLNRSDLTANNNKFYVLELHAAAGKYRLFTHYGRVGTAGTCEARFADEGEALEHEFERILREKTGPKKGYVPVDVAKPVVGSEALQTQTADNHAQTRGVHCPSALHPSVARFVEHIYDESKAELVRRVDTPLGALSKEQIERGADKLRELRFAIARGREERIVALSSQYYSLIPHRFGRRIAPEEAAISTIGKADEEEELLQLMRDIFSIQKAMDAEADRKYRALGAQIEAMEANDPETQRVTRQILETQSARHGFNIKVGQVFRACLPDERARFDAAPGNNRLLFHGSRNANMVGILSRGLLIAPKNVPVSGYMFGKGIYFADQSTKSAQYSGLYDGGRRGGIGYLFLADVALGRIKKQWTPVYREEAPDGFHSVQGCKGLCLLHNEFIIYRREQCTIRYVAEIRKA